MTDRAIERRLADYLDGRMSPPERRAFEELLGERPDLALRVRSATEVGEALREGVDLPPGFYARGRRRFEAAREDAPYGFRLVSWEVLGLAAAAALAFALFVPHFLRGPVPLPAPVPATEPAPTAGKSPAPPARREIAVPRDTGAAREDRDTPAAESAGAALETPPTPEPQRSSPVADAEERSARAPASAGERAGNERRFAAAKSSVAQAVAAGAVRVPAGALPPGVVGPGEVRSVDDEATWRALLAGEAGTALAALGPPDPAMRVVLIGAREGLAACGDYELRTTPEGWEVRYARGPDTGAAPACALRLPRDGRPVSVVEAP